MAITLRESDLKIGLLLALIYVISGKLSLMLALPPGYASPIFLPAGIALAAVLINGRKVLPWILLGALLLNLWISYSTSQDINLTGLAAAPIIAVASLLQAAAGGWALRKVIGYPTAFDQGDDILRFLLLSPFICLVSASMSVGGLLALGIIDLDRVASTWATWWIGDTLGVLVMLPLTLTVAGRPQAMWRRRIITVALPMLVLFLIFVASFLKINQWEYTASLSDFHRYSQQTVVQVQTKLEQQESLLEQLAALFVREANGTVTRAEFRQFVQKSLIRFPMIQAVSWVPKINKENRTPFESAQAMALPGFEIRELNDAGQLRTAGPRDVYYPVTYIEPLSSNEAAVGFDLASNALREEAVTKARQSGTLIASAALKLVQERQNQAGVLLIMAINPHDKASGVVSTVLRMGDFMGKLLPDVRPMLYTRLIDLDEQKPLYDNFMLGASPVLFKQTFEFGTRHYRLETAPTPAYFKQHQGWQSWGVLAIGMLSTGLLGALLLLGTGYTARIEVQVEDRTRKLKESEYRWKFALEGSGDGVWDWDISNNTVFYSRRWKAMLGFTDNEIGNSLNEWKKRIHPEDKAETLAIVQAYLSDITPVYVSEHRVKCKDGSWRWLLDRGMVVSRDPDGKPLRMIGTHTDITERKESEQLAHYMAHYDALTDLPNRTLLSDRLQQSLARARREQEHLALMFIDLDNFKPINDEYGHDVGDLLLKAVAQRMQDCLRKSDTVARIGGDEFVVLLPVIRAEQDAMLVAEKIRVALGQSFALEEQHLTISSSIGVVVYPEHGENEKHLMKNADIAMYHAKKCGRNSAKLYQPDLDNAQKLLALQPVL